MSDYLRKFEGLFTLTPQRMRMIVEAFEEALEKGLSEWDQCVVSANCSYDGHTAVTDRYAPIFVDGETYIPVADVPNLGIRLTDWKRNW